MGAIREVSYNRPGKIVLGIETLSLDELQQRAGPEHLAGLQRIQFFLLLLFTEGAGEHMVDFITYPTQPNVLMLVRPGQVQQFHLNPTLRGQLIVIDPSFLMPERALSEGAPNRLWWSACTALPDELAQTFRVIAADIASDSRQYDGHPLRRTLLQHQLYTLLLRLRLFNEGSPSSSASRRAYDIVTEFKHLVEEEYADHRSVPFYAARLGYAEKTLTRACLLIEGRSAKTMLDQRVILEAKRLLAHSRDGVAAIAGLLGFSEPTNFIRFFKKYEQVTPAAFRDQHTRPH